MDKGKKTDTRAQLSSTDTYSERVECPLPSPIRFHAVRGRGECAGSASPERRYCSRGCWRAEAAALDLVQRWFSRFSVRFPRSVAFGPFVWCPAAMLPPLFPRPGKPSVIRSRRVGRLTEREFGVVRPCVQTQTETAVPGRARPSTVVTTPLLQSRPTRGRVALSTAAGNAFLRLTTTV